MHVFICNIILQGVLIMKLFSICLDVSEALGEGTLYKCFVDIRGTSGGS